MSQRTSSFLISHARQTTGLPHSSLEISRIHAVRLRLEPTTHIVSLIMSISAGVVAFD